jgi:hypothetical protein
MCDVIAGPSSSFSEMPSMRSVCLGILMASCLAIFFYRDDLLISKSSDSLHIRAKGHLGMRSLMKEQGARIHALRQRHADTQPTIRYHAGDSPFGCMTSGAAHQQCIHGKGSLDAGEALDKVSPVCVALAES